MKFKAPVWVLVLVALGGAALGAGGALLYGHLLPNSGRPPLGTASQRLGQLPTFGTSRKDERPTKVAALGRLTPEGEVIEIGGLMGDRLGKLEVEEDQWVEQGAILAYLESHGERKAERDTLAAQLREAKARRTAELAYADAQIREAELGVEQAKELDPLDIKAQEAKVQLLETEVKASEADLRRLRSLSSPGTVPQQKLDQQAQFVRRFQQELVVARANLTKARTGHRLNQQRAQAQLDAARAGRQRAEAAVQIESLTKGLATADVRLKRTVLRAPRAGRVLKILTRPGERTDSKPILKLGDTRVMYAVIEVYETDILWVRPGQRVRVTSPALPKSPELSGTVERVGKIISKKDVLHIDPAAAADARVVEVWARLGKSEAAPQLTNLQVDAWIDVASAGTSSAAAPEGGGRTPLRR